MPILAIVLTVVGQRAGYLKSNADNLTGSILILAIIAIAGIASLVAIFVELGAARADKGGWLPPALALAVWPSLPSIQFKKTAEAFGWAALLNSDAAPVPAVR